MSESYIPAHLRRLVEQRANFEREYCQLPSGLSFFPHEIDHIIESNLQSLRTSFSPKYSVITGPIRQVTMI